MAILLHEQIARHTATPEELEISSFREITRKVFKTSRQNKKTHIFEDH